jgi:hypothetical protein
VIGNGIRTNTHGIDSFCPGFWLATIRGNGISWYRNYPISPNRSFTSIWFFTMLDFDKCMVYEPIILSLTVTKPFTSQSIKVRLGDKNGVITSWLLSKSLVSI